MTKGVVRINYKHLRYFHEVARAGSLSDAARRLHVAPQTVSAQIRSLEETLGCALFERAGRRMVVTDEGRIALDYAESIFALGQELGGVLAGRAQPRRLSLRLGITDSVPKLLVAQLLDPLIQRHRGRLELDCSEGSVAELLGQLASHQLDAVLAEQPVPPHLARTMRGVRLVDSGVSFLAPAAVAAAARGKRFPRSLDGAPLINWAVDSPLGSAIDAWLADEGLQARVVCRCDDSALMKVLAQRGLGVVAVPSAIERDVARQFGLKLLGRVPELKQPVYLIGPVRRQPHPLLAELGAG
jgi:LysR family transcriptional activator of nhaA